MKKISLVITTINKLNKNIKNFDNMTQKEKWNFYVGVEPAYDDEFDVYKGILSTPAIASDGTIYFSSLSL